MAGGRGQATLHSAPDPSASGPTPHTVLVFRSFAAWLLILLLAVLNGFFREAVLLPNVGKPAAFFVSGLLLSLLIIIVTVALAKWMALDTGRRGFFVGCFWLGLTLFFEFAFGGIAQGKSWREMLEAYTFRDGNLWPVVLGVTLLAPLAAARILPRRGNGQEDVAKG